MRKLKYTWIRIKRRVLGLKPGEMYAEFSKGKFVDVTRTLDGRVLIHSHTKYPFAPKGTILLIPYQSNHGVMVEFIDENGKPQWRNHMSYQDFYTRFANSNEQAATLNNQSKEVIKSDEIIMPKAAKPAEGSRIPPAPKTSYCENCNKAPVIGNGLCSDCSFSEDLDKLKNK